MLRRAYVKSKRAGFEVTNKLTCEAGFSMNVGILCKSVYAAYMLY